MHTIKVDTSQGSYDIIIGEELDFSVLLSQYVQSRKVFIITDTNVDMHCWSKLKSYFQNIQYEKLVIHPGEQSKSLSSYSNLIEDILDRRIERNDLIIAFGGGVVGDLAGFISATVLRGVDFIQIPTTLLSQVDSSIGGKTGINSQYGKNMIGAFKQPIAVFIDVFFLETLSKEEFLSGYMEVIKHAAIYDADFFEYLHENLQKIIDRKSDIVIEIIKRSCAIKADIVQRDEKEESGLRAMVNFGHTIGHVIEISLGVRHGEAIAYGMIVEAHISHNMELCTQDCVQMLRDHVVATGIAIPSDNIIDLIHDDSFKQLILNDKKNQNGKIRFALLKEIGSAFLHDGMSWNDMITNL